MAIFRDVIPDRIVDMWWNNEKNALCAQNLTLCLLIRSGDYA